MREVGREGQTNLQTKTGTNIIPKFGKKLGNLGTQKQKTRKCRMQRLVKRKELGKIVIRQVGNRKKEHGMTVVRQVGKRSGSRMMEVGIAKQIWPLQLTHLLRQPEATTKVDTGIEVLLRQPEVTTKVAIGRKISDIPERDRRLRRYRRRL